MEENDTTTIQIDVETYKRLNGRKGPSETFDDVVAGVLDENERLRERVDELEDRVGDLEAGVVEESRQPDDTTAEPTSATPSSADEPRGSDVEEPPHEPPTGTRTDTDDLAAEFRDYLRGRSPQKTYTKDALVDAFRLLRDRGPLKTKELKEELYPRYEEHYSDEVSLWNSIDRHMKSLDVFTKPGYGEWGYAGDDVLQDLLDEAQGNYFD